MNKGEKRLKQAQIDVVQDVQEVWLNRLFESQFVKSLRKFQMRR